MTRTKQLLALSVSVVCALSGSAYAQTNPLAASRQSASWSSAGATIQSRSAICSTLNPGATAAQINAAIQSCPSGQVVFLNAGTYNLSAGITFNGKANVTLRGAGPDRTFLKFTGKDACSGASATICVTPVYLNYPGGPQNSATWTGGYTLGTTTITLSSTTNLAVNSQLVLDQLNDPLSDNGEFMVAGNDSGAVNTFCSSCGAGTGRTGRGQMFFTRVTAINGNTVTIADPLIHPNWRGSQAPGAWWAGSGVALPLLMNVGLEDFSVDHTAATTASFGIYIGNATNSWVKNIRSITLANPNIRSQLRLYQSSHVTVRDSYFYGKSGASGNYGIESYMSSTNLLENNIGECNSTTVTDATSGTVFAYNFILNDCYVNFNWMQPGHSFHAPGNAFVLLEGNDSAGIQLDNIHGTADFITGYRNRWHGWENGKQTQTVAVHNYAFTRFTNILGNVLGQPGFHNNYQSSPVDSGTCSSSVYSLGWGGNCGSASNGLNDLLVKTTMMRWGNYDAATASSRFVAAEVPSGLAKYSNPVPSSQALPASLYLFSRPSWWPASTPFPAIGPDVTGGDEANVGGHAYSIPAKVCYATLQSDPAYATSRGISSATVAGYTSGVLITLNVGSHNIAVGDSIGVAGVSPAAYNGSFLVYSVTSTTVTYGLLSNPGAYAGGGVVTQPNVKIFNASSCYQGGGAQGGPAAPANLRISSGA